MQNNNTGNQKAPNQAVPDPNVKPKLSCQNPTTGDQSLAPQTTAKKVQDDNKGNQTASTQAVPKPKPKFSCKDCSYTCNSLLNFRLHLQTVHGKIYEEPQTTSTLKPAEQKKEKPPEKPVAVAVTIQTEQKKEKPPEKPAVVVNIETEKRNEKPAVNIQPGAVTANSGKNIDYIPRAEREPLIVKWKPAVNMKAENKKGRAAKNFQPRAVTASSGRIIVKLHDYISRADREPLIGLEYVLEYCLLSEEGEIETKYFCEICECDTDVDRMVEHLAGFGHRKLYLAKEYPYVLKAKYSSNEDHSQFIRRMALEIEREEGTKMYMIDTSMCMESMATLKAAEKKMRKKTRWDDKNDRARIKKALKFLETFEVDHEIEATTVTRLCEKLTENLKVYNEKLKEEALFPSRVAKAQDVANSLTMNAERPRPHFPPPFMKGPPNFPENGNFINKVGMPRGFPGPRPNFQNMDAKHNMPMAPPYRPPQQYPFVPANEKPAMQGPPMPTMKAQNAQSDSDSFLRTLSQEDTQFFKKLKALLEVLPQNASLSDNSQMNSKMLMLKSLFENKNRAEHEEPNQKMMMQVASMVQDTVKAQNASVNQQLTMLMTSQNSTAMVMQTSSVRNNPRQPNENSVMNRAGLGPGIQSSGNLQTNMNLPFNQNFGSQAHGQMGQMESRPMDQNTYRVPAEMQNYPSTSRNYDNFGYGKPVEGNYLSKGDSYITQRDGKQNERMPNSNTDMGFEAGVYGKKLDNSYYGGTSAQVSESRYVDRTEKQAPYTRVGPSPSTSQNQYNNYNDNIRGEVEKQDTKQQHGLRSYNSTDWGAQETNTQYNKRARLDMDNRSSYQNRSFESLGINTANMPEELRNRIQGKDLFTVSAILSEYSERRSGK